jgi:organic radical activating enzyme
VEPINQTPLKASDCSGGYKPTKEEINNLKPVPDTFLVSGDWIFTTIQGEGTRLGKVTTFVRLHKCNLRCSWCDTWYTWKADEKEFWSEPKLLNRTDLRESVFDDQRSKGIDTEVKRIVFTGGEPMLQQKEIVTWIEENPDFEVEIETNGTILPKEELLTNPNVHFNCSPKLDSSGNSKIARFRENALLAISSKPSSCFKFVCSSPQDIEDVLAEYGFLPREQIWIMPEGVTKEENFVAYEAIRDSLLKYNLQTTPRLQNIIFNGALRGI